MVKSILPLVTVLAGVTGVMTSDAGETNVYRIVRGADWVPVNFLRSVEPGGAFDFSQMGFVDAPAGKHGWLKVRDGHFAFEDSLDVRRRFSGPSLLHEAMCPPVEEADAIADRLVRLGYNSVRVIGWDATLAMGPGYWDADYDRTQYLPEKIDRFDRFMAACFQRGVYATIDICGNRHFKWGDATETCGHDPKSLMINPDYRALCLFDEKAYQDLCDYTRKFFTHRNPYTGRTYAEEKGIPLVSPMSEQLVSERFELFKGHSSLDAAWQDWVRRGRQEDPEYFKDVVGDLSDLSKLPSLNSGVLYRFEAELERRFFTRFRTFLREELGVKALLSDMDVREGNIFRMSVAEDLYDCTDVHLYNSHPDFANGMISCGGQDPATTEWLGGIGCAFQRLAKCPLTFREWDYCYPSRFRVCAGLLVGSAAGLQEYDGIWRFCWDLPWGDNCRQYADGCHQPMNATSILTDPLGVASERLTSLLFLRGDVPPLPEPGLALRLRAEDRFRRNWRSVSYNKCPTAALWRMKACQVIGGKAPEGWKEISFDDLERAGQDLSLLPVKLDPNPVVRRDFTNRVLTVTTRRTAAGFAYPTSGRVKAGPFSFILGGSHAAVFATSVDAEPTALEEAKRILVMHLTDAQAEGCEFTDETRTLMTKRSDGLPLVATGTAKIRLDLRNPGAYTVWALDLSGRRIERVPTCTRFGALAFLASVRGSDGTARIAYEVVRDTVSLRK